MRAARLATRGLAAVWTIGLLLQFYAAGFGIIGGGTMEAHQRLGWLLIPIAVATLLASLAARAGWPVVVRFLAAAALVGLQPALILVVRHYAPPLAAIHAVNGVFVLAFVTDALRRTWPALASGRGEAPVGTA